MFAEVEEEKRVPVEQVRALRPSVRIGIFCEHIEGESFRTQTVHLAKSPDHELLPVFVSRIKLNIENRACYQIICDGQFVFMSCEMCIWEVLVGFAGCHHHLLNYVHAKVFKLPFFPVQKVEHGAITASVINQRERARRLNDFYQLFKTTLLSFGPVIIHSPGGRAELFKFPGKILVQSLLGFIETHNHFLWPLRYTSMNLFPS